MEVYVIASWVMRLTHTFFTHVSRIVALKEAHSHLSRHYDTRPEKIHLTVTDIINTLPGYTFIMQDEYSELENANRVVN